MSEPTSPGPLLSLENIVLRFGERTILDGVSLQVQPQERVVIMGQSGGGKSTLLRLMMGILQPTAGRVRFGEHEVNQLGRRQLNALRAKMGMVYQYSALISSLNVRGNLALPMEELTNMTRGEIERVIDLLDAQPIGLQIGIVDGSMPNVTFQVFERPGKAYVATSPFRFGEFPNVSTGIATVTAAPEAVRLYTTMVNDLWQRAYKGRDGAALLRRMLNSV